NTHRALPADDPRFARAQEIAGGRLAPATRSFAPNAYRFDWSDRAQYDAWRWLHQGFEDDGVRHLWLDFCCDDSPAGVPGVSPDAWVTERYRVEGDARGQRGFAVSRI